MECEDNNRHLVNHNSNEDHNENVGTNTETPLIYEIGNSIEIREGYLGVRNCFRDLNQFISNRLNYVITKLKEDSIHPQAEPQLQSTPSMKRNVGRKRPVPNSTSVKKIVIHSSKRLATDGQDDENKTNTRTGARKLFSDSKSKKETKEEPEQFIELMTELSINSDQSIANKNKDRVEVAKPQFISQKSSLAPQSSTVVANSTTSSMNSTTSTRSTRYQTRLASANTTTNQTPAKTTNSRPKAKVSTSSLKSSAFNTPKRANNNNNNKPANDSIVLDQNPAAAAVPRMPNTPSFTHLRRKELEAEKKQKLMMSQEKAKKAIQNRDAILSSKQDVLRNRLAERQRKMELFKEKQLEKERQTREKLLNKFCSQAGPVPGQQPPSPSISHQTKFPAQAARSTRAKKLSHDQTTSAKVKRQNSTSSLKSASSSTTNNPKKDSINSKLSTSSSMKKLSSFSSKLTKAAKTTAGTKGKEPKNKLDLASKLTDKETNQHADLLTSDESGDSKVEPMDTCDRAESEPFSTIKLSPIHKVENGSGQLGTLVNTVALSNALHPGPIGSQLTDISIAGQLSSTVVQNNNPNGTFVCPAVPPPAPSTPSNMNGTFSVVNKNLSKVQEMSSSINNYPITPPPRKASVSTYDISALVDSEDEESCLPQDSQRKPIPKWAQGKPFLTAIKEQFSKSPAEIHRQAKQIFSLGIVLPIPVEEMGLIIHDRYATRSSSVNWNDFNNQSLYGKL